MALASSLVSATRARNHYISVTSTFIAQRWGATDLLGALPARTLKGLSCRRKMGPMG